VNKNINRGARTFCQGEVLKKQGDFTLLQGGFAPLQGDFAPLQGCKVFLQVRNLKPKNKKMDFDKGSCQSFFVNNWVLNQSFST
jgi:hypothetical protein